MHLVTSYIKFLWKSKNEYSVHSPFVFDLLTQCLYDRTNYHDYELLVRYRRALLENQQTIEVTDFGAGSKVFKSNTRQVSAIAKNAGISRSRAMLLYRLSRYFKPQNTLEIGTSLGLATAALALGYPDGKVTTLEGCPQTIGVAQKQFEQFKLENISCRIGEFSQTLNLPDQKFDLVYFDGNHQKQATLDYFNLLLPTAHNDSVWIFDDIHWSAGMEEAWEIIKQNPNVRVTIDTFQWGLVFFRKEQPRQDFVIRC